MTKYCPSLVASVSHRVPLQTPFRLPSRISKYLPCLLFASPYLISHVRTTTVRSGLPFRVRPFPSTQHLAHKRWRSLWITTFCGTHIHGTLDPTCTKLLRRNKPTLPLCHKSSFTRPPMSLCRLEYTSSGSVHVQTLQQFFWACNRKIQSCFAQQLSKRSIDGFGQPSVSTFGGTWVGLKASSECLPLSPLTM